MHVWRKDSAPIRNKNHSDTFINIFMSSLRSPRKSLIGEVTSDITLYIISLSNYSKCTLIFRSCSSLWGQPGSKRSQQPRSSQHIPRTTKDCIREDAKKKFSLNGRAGRPSQPCTPPSPIQYFVTILWGPRASCLLPPPLCTGLCMDSRGQGPNRGCPQPPPLYCSIPGL